MSILLFLVSGFLAGLVARALLPGTSSLTLPATTAVSLFGALLVGIVANVAFARSLTGIHAAGLIGSLVGTLATMGLVSFKLTRGEEMEQAR